MNHVKKLILVPQETVARMHETPTFTPQTQMNSLDTEMSHILSKKYADDSQKWKMYNETLQRYLHFAGETRKPLTIELDSKVDDSTRIEAVREQLAAAVPKTYKAQALRIHDYLSQNHSTVTWDSTGTLSINGSAIPHSNIIDSISDLTRMRKNFVPAGTDELCRALAQMNVPLELLGNPSRRTLVQKLKTQKGGGVVLPKKKDTPRSFKRKPATAKKTLKKVAKNAWKTW